MFVGGSNSGGDPVILHRQLPDSVYHSPLGNLHQVPLWRQPVSIHCPVCCLQRPCYSRPWKGEINTESCQLSHIFIIYLRFLAVLATDERYKTIIWFRPEIIMEVWNNGYINKVFCRSQNFWIFFNFGKSFSNNLNRIYCQVLYIIWLTLHICKLFLKNGS